METVQDEALAEHMRRLNLLQYAATIDRVSVGMWVFDMRHGWGIVRGLSEGLMSDMQISVEIGNDIYSYHQSGKFFAEDKHPSLFLIDIFEGTMPPEPEPDWSKVPMDTDVEVKRDESDAWSKRKLCAYLPNAKDKFICFSQGDSSTSDGYVETCAWQICRLAVDCKPEWLRK